MTPYKNQIRIIGGTHKRRLIRFPDMLGVESFRPTPDRVRETLFNWLGKILTANAVWTCLQAPARWRLRRPHVVL